MINLVSDIVYKQGDKIKDFEMKEKKVREILIDHQSIKHNQRIRRDSTLF